MHSVEVLCENVRRAKNTFQSGTMETIFSTIVQLLCLSKENFLKVNSILQMFSIN